MSILQELSSSPLVLQTINPLFAYGPCCVQGPDGKDQKDSGMITVAGNMFLVVARQNPLAVTPYIPMFNGQMIESRNNGVSWNNFQTPNSYLQPGNPTSPFNTSMWGNSPTSFGSGTFVMGCGDDGTLGYTIACNQTDDRDAYVYIIGNDTNYAGGSACSSGDGDDLYMMRVARAKIANLNPADYEFFTGGDGNLDSNWSSTLANATSILHNCGKLGNSNVQYVPAKNSYVMLTYYATSGLSSGTNNTTWQGWTAPHPWGPWTNIYT